MTEALICCIDCAACIDFSAAAYVDFGLHTLTCDELSLRVVGVTHEGLVHQERLCWLKHPVDRRNATISLIFARQKEL